MAILNLPHLPQSPSWRDWDWVQPLRCWLNQLEVQHLAIANLICFLIPASCPFERDVRFLGRYLFHIPPLCHFIPVFDEQWLCASALCFFLKK